MSIEQQIFAASESIYLLVDVTLMVRSIGGNSTVLSPQQLLPGQALVDVLPELYGNEPVLRKILTGELAQLQLFEVNREEPPGDTRYLDLLTIPQRDEQGAICGLIQVVTDVTERGAREQARVQQRNENLLLKEQIARQNIELARINAELRRTNDLKNEFLTTMSHEVRTPLTAVLGLSEVLRTEMTGPLNSRQMELLGGIEENGRHLLDLINDFLDVARIEAGRLGLDRVVTVVSMLAAASLGMVKELAAKKDITCSLDIDPQVLLIEADERRFRQILINLLANAIKFTPAGGEVGLKVIGVPDANLVQFVVWDTGIGIAPEDMPRLFRPFSQVRRGSQHGSGLGLLLVARLTALHKGGLALDSRLDVGSQFTVTLPWRKAQQEQLKRYLGQSAPASDDVVSNAEHMVVTAVLNSQAPLLLIEVDQVASSGLADRFRQAGCRIVVAEESEEALEYLRTETPSLILLHAGLHAADQLELLRDMRARTAAQAVPIITLAALILPGDEERFRAAGANAYMRQPIQWSRLIESIANLLT